MANAVEVHNLSKVYKIFPSSIKRAIDAIGIKQEYKEFEALKNVTLEFEEAEVHAILGKNGSGKSTLLKIITGVVTPTSGEVVVNGRISAMLELTSGFDPDLTGIENVFMKALTMGLKHEEIEARIQDVIDFADIGDHINQPFRTYSSGMKARLGFAVAVNVNPDILIVDEVLAVGDDIFKMKCIDRMANFRRQGKTILFVSHSLNTVKAFCTRGVWINKGVVEAEGLLGDVVVQYEAFLKDERARIREETLAKATANPQATAARAITKRDLLTVGAFHFLTPAGQEKDTYAFGEPISWSFDYNVRGKDIGVLTACFSLYDAESLELLVVDKRRFEIDITSGRHHAQFVIPEPHLLPGKYLLTGEVWETDSSCLFRYANKRAFYITQTDYLGTGCFFMEHTLTVDEKELAPAIYNTAAIDEREVTVIEVSNLEEADLD